MLHMLGEEIQKRYTIEAEKGDNLICGGNIAFLNITPGDCILDLAAAAKRGRSIPSSVGVT